MIFPATEKYFIKKPTLQMVLAQMACELQTSISINYLSMTKHQR